MPPTAEEAQRRLETLPSTFRATFVGILIGICISIVAAVSSEADIRTAKYQRKLTIEQKVGIAGVVFVILVIIGAVASTLPQSSRSAASVNSWHNVSTFSGGSSNANTTTFYIKGSESRLQWSYTTTRPEIALFSAFLYRDGDPYGPVTQAVCRDVNTDVPYSCPQPNSSGETGTAYINYGPNTFYLQVISTVTSWNLTVQDFY